MSQPVKNIDEPDSAAARSGGGGGFNTPSKETPITIPPSIPYGFQETHTCIIPYKTYFSAIKLVHSTPVIAGFRMNSHYTPALFTPTTPVALAAITTGLYNAPTTNEANWDNPLNTFPATATTSGRSWYNNLFSKMYEKYTVLSCEWTLTAKVPNTANNRSAIICWDYDTYGTSSTGNIVPTMNLFDMTSQKNIKKKILETYNNSRETDVTIISETIKPGQNKRNVANDGDYVTWTSTNNAPNFVDALKFFFYKAPLQPTAGDANIVCELEIKYIVQFKDLVESFRYPYSSSTAISLTTPTDILGLP